MDDQWEHSTAGEVRPGDRVRVREVELTVSRIEDSFLGRTGMIAFIEDTDERWLKVPTSPDAELEVNRGA